MKTTYLIIIALSIVFFLTRLPSPAVLSPEEASYLIITKSLFNKAPVTGSVTQAYSLFLYLATIPFSYNELIIKFVNLLIGLSFIIASYFLLKELVDKKFALITSIVIMTQWVFNFYSVRITIETPAALLLVLSNYFFIKKENKNDLLSGVFLGLAVSLKPLLILTGLIYLIINKKRWLIGLLIVIPLYFSGLVNNDFFYKNQELLFNDSFNTPAYYVMTMLLNYGALMGFLFFIGLITLILNSKKNLFVLLNLIVYFTVYSLFISFKDVKLLIHLLPFISLTSIIGALFIIKSLSKNKMLLLPIIILIVLLSSVENLSTGVKYANLTKNEYTELKYAGEYLKTETGRVMSQSVSQITYYSEKETDPFPINETVFLSNIKNYSFIVINSYERTPDYFYNNNYSFISPIKAYPSINDPKLIIYLVNTTS